MVRLDRSEYVGETSDSSLASVSSDECPRLRLSSARSPLCSGRIVFTFVAVYLVPSIAFHPALRRSSDFKSQPVIGLRLIRVSHPEGLQRSKAHGRGTEVPPTRQAILRGPRVTLNRRKQRPQRGGKVFGRVVTGSAQYFPNQSEPTQEGLQSLIPTLPQLSAPI